MDIVDSPSHRALAKQAAIEGLVLLKNQANMLPLRPTAETNNSLKIAVVGPNANRTLTLASNYAGCKSHAGGPILNSCTFVTPLQGIIAAASKLPNVNSTILYEEGVQIDTPDTSGIVAAVAAAKLADVTIVVTGCVRAMSASNKQNFKK